MDHEYDVYGFDQNGIHKDTGTKYNLDGYDRYGYNQKGYNMLGYFKDTNTKFDKYGYDKYGYDKYGYDKDGYDFLGFNKEGINRDTGVKYDRRGFDQTGHHINGYGGYNSVQEYYDECAHSRFFYNRAGYNGLGYNIHGIDEFNFNIGSRLHEKTHDKYNSRGFRYTKLYKDTKSKYDEYGYDFYGYDKNGYDFYGYNKEGYDKDGFNHAGIHKDTRTLYNKHDFDKNHIHRVTNTEYNEYGFNIDGINKYTNDKYDLEGNDIDGLDSHGFNEDMRKDRSKRFIIIKSYIDGLSNGTLSIEQFRAKSNMKIEDLYQIAKKSDYSNDVLLKIRKKFKEYHRYDKLISPEQMEKTISFYIDGKETSLVGRLDEIKKMRDYLGNNHIYVCEYNLKKYMKYYLEGKIDFDKTLEENLAVINTEKKEEQENKTSALTTKELEQLKQFRSLVKQLKSQKASSEGVKDNDSQPTRGSM